MHELPEQHSQKEDVAISLIPKLNYTRILVVGCGSGSEATALAQYFGCEVIGIDISDEFFVQSESDLVTLKVMDAQNMSFPDSHFDLVYSYHALEHIPHLGMVLSEMKRVAKPSSQYFFGTPNRDRILGYIGAAESLRNKIKWNLEDFSARLHGQWENELGAHAGFSRRELMLIGKTLGTVEDMTLAYYKALYRKRLRFIQLIQFLRLGALAFPCVYVQGQFHGPRAHA